MRRLDFNRKSFESWAALGAVALDAETSAAVLKAASLFWQKRQGVIVKQMLYLLRFFVYRIPLAVPISLFVCRKGECIARLIAFQNTQTLA